MEMPDSNRVNTNLGQVEMDAAPHFFGRQMDWSDVSEMLELLHKETRNPNRCISKGQFKTACEGLLVQNLLLQKRMREVLEESAVALGKHPIVFTEDGRLHATVPASEVLAVFMACIPVLEKDAAEQAAAVPEGQSKPELKIVKPTTNDGS